MSELLTGEEAYILSKKYTDNSVGGSGGAVNSVNGATGTVVLDASDILMSDGESTIEARVNGITAIVSLDSLGLEGYTGTTTSFITAIRASTMAVGSMAIGPVSLSDLPGGLGNCELVVTRTDAYATNLSISSNNRPPYQWFFNHWVDGSTANNVWRTYIDGVVALPTLTESSLTEFTIDSLCDNHKYNLTGEVTSLTITATSQTVNGEESTIYLTTGDTITFNPTSDINVIGSAELSANTSYVISIQNNIMVIGEVS